MQESMARRGFAAKVGIGTNGKNITERFTKWGVYRDLQAGEPYEFVAMKHDVPAGMVFAALFRLRNPAK